jgi:hypothetical protein
MSEFSQVYVLPFQFILVLRLAVVGFVTESQDTEHGEVLGDVKNTTNHSVGTRTVRESAASHLHPAGTESQVSSLVLHGDGSDRAVFYPAVVGYRVAQYDNG